MPRINGKQFLKLFRQQPEWSNIPVAVYSTTASEREKKETLDLGASYFITKPSCVTGIAEQLETLLS
jgi:CheY-like chemotaxis protein